MNDFEKIAAAVERIAAAEERRAACAERSVELDAARQATYDKGVQGILAALEAVTTQMGQGFPPRELGSPT